MHHKGTSDCSMASSAVNKTIVYNIIQNRSRYLAKYLAKYLKPMNVKNMIYNKYDHTSASLIMLLQC